MRDCITLVVNLLPSKEHLRICEKEMLRMLSEARLPCQNRLIDYEKKAPYYMSMTDMYALGLVAELGFRRGCAAMQSMPNSVFISEICTSAIELVGSRANLICEIWYRPNQEKDGVPVFINYGRNNCTSVLNRIQLLVHEHIEKVEAIFCRSDEDKEALEDRCCSRQRKMELAILHSQAITAIKCVDKPNVHRLREMVRTTLPMVGHMSLIGELVLEKAPQRLKRALKQSNIKYAHLQSMLSVSFDDWRGRSTSIASGCFENDKHAVACCSRLLSGREPIEALNGGISPTLKNEIRTALGPELCILTELRCQANSVLSPRSSSVSKFHWSVKGAVRPVPCNESPAPGDFRVEKYIRKALRMTSKIAKCLLRTQSLPRPSQVLQGAFSNEVMWWRRCAIIQMI